MADEPIGTEETDRLTVSVMTDGKVWGCPDHKPRWTTKIQRDEEEYIYIECVSCGHTQTMHPLWFEKFRDRYDLTVFVPENFADTANDLIEKAHAEVARRMS